MSEWDKLKQHKFLTANNKDLYIEDFMTQMWFVGDKLQRDTKNLAYEITVHKKKILELEQKLKTGSRMLDDWEKSTTHPDATLVNIRNLKKVFTQNTDYVQKEETKNE